MTFYENLTEWSEKLSEVIMTSYLCHNTILLTTSTHKMALLLRSHTTLKIKWILGFFTGSRNEIKWFFLGWLFHFFFHFLETSKDKVLSRNISVWLASIKSVLNHLQYFALWANAQFGILIISRSHVIDFFAKTQFEFIPLLTACGQEN